MNRKAIGIGAGILALVLITAGASAMITHEVMQDKPVAQEKVVKAAPVRAKKETITWNDAPPPPQRQAQALPPCDDGNVVGHVAGGVVGGIAGNQVGSGNGQTVATIAGTLGGAYLGGRYLPTRGATCR